MCFLFLATVTTINLCVLQKSFTSIAVKCFSFTQWTLIRLLGMFPFPLIYGGVLQSFCLLWSNSHGEPAVCRFYDVNKISLGMTVFVTCQKVSYLTFFD